MSAGQQIFDGDTHFSLGTNSFSDPLRLPEGCYPFSWNMVNRGGVLSTRPGFDWAYTLPDGALQGGFTYAPQTGFPQHVAVVDGKLYVADYPFREYRQVGGATLSASAKRVYFALTTRTVKRNTDGSLAFISPVNLLVIQDGVSPAVYYDGSTATASVGQFAIPQGTAMAWDGKRLWVARGSKVFASDISDATSFYEQQFNTLGGLSYFIVPGAVTGMGVTSGVSTPQLLVFTATTTTAFKSYIVDRTQWSNTPQFQWTVFPEIGCVSHNSITSRNGLLWWYSQNGTLRLDIAEASQLTSTVVVYDNEMVRSKSRLHSDLSGIAAVTHENYLLMSVPHAARTNTHTWVHDSSPEALVSQQLPPSWCSIWTGVRPVQWFQVEMFGVVRTFCASNDLDGKNRVYEAFKQSGRDNGCDFPWSFETRPYTGKTIEPKQFNWAEMFVSGVRGQLDLKVSYAGAAWGKWKKCLVTKFIATEGNLVADRVYTLDSLIYAYKSQARRFRSESAVNLKPEALSTVGIEATDNEGVDRAHQLKVEGSGSIRVHLLRLAMDVYPEDQFLHIPNEESVDKFVRFDGAASLKENDLDAPLEGFSSMKGFTAKLRNYVAKATASVRSAVSQADADKRASQVAAARANHALRIKHPKRVGGTQAASVRVPVLTANQSAESLSWAWPWEAPDYWQVQRLPVGEDVWVNYVTVAGDEPTILGFAEPNYYYKVFGVVEGQPLAESNTVLMTGAEI